VKKTFARAFLPLVLSLGAAAASAQSTALWIQSEPGDYIGQGQTNLYQAPPTTVSVWRRDWDQSIDVSFGDWWLSLAARGNQPLATGAYEMAARSSFRGTSAGLDFSGQGRGCNTVQGRFSVLEVAYDSGGSVTKLAVNFEEHCEGLAPALYGELRVNSSIPLTLQKPPQSTTPDAFAFLAQSFVRPVSEIISSQTAIYGINAPAPISILGGGYSINGGPFTSSSGFVNPRDHVRIRMLSSPVPGKAVSATLTVGGVSSTFQATSYQPGTPLSSLYYLSAPGDYIGQGQEAFYVGQDLRTTVVDNGTEKEFQFATPAGGWWYLRLGAAGGAPLQPGTYKNAQRSVSSTQPGLDFSGDGRGCNETSGEFDVLEAQYGSDGALQRFAADFVQHCEITGPPLYGEVRFKSTIPPSTLTEPSGVAPSRWPRPANLSTRLSIGTGENVGIAGFVISGSASKTVAIRAIGPSLTSYGVADALANPVVTLVRSSDGAVIATNDSWQADPNAAQLSASGFAPSNPAEAAVLVNLEPGPYTAIVSGANGATGVALVEVYEVDRPEVPLINISTRGQVLDGNGVMIGGFVIGGDFPQTVVIRALGPSLAKSGIAHPLENPRLTLVRMSDQSVVAENDDWGAAQNAAWISSAGLAPSDANEAAIVATLDPGAYTAIVRGADGQTGVAIVEAYTQ